MTNSVKKRSVWCKFYNITIFFHSCKHCSFCKCRFYRIFLIFIVACVFTSKNANVSWIIVVKINIFVKPFWFNVIMFINCISKIRIFCTFCFIKIPGLCMKFVIYKRPGSSQAFNFWVNFVNCFFKCNISRGNINIFAFPLFVSNCK